MAKKINQTEILDNVYQHAILPRKPLKRVVDLIFKEILWQISQGNEVTIREFGTFTSHNTHKHPRRCYFRPSKFYREVMAQVEGKYIIDRRKQWEKLVDSSIN